MQADNTLYDSRKNICLINMQHMLSKKTYFFISGIGVLLSFFAFVSALRGISIGIWPQSETTMMSIHICSFISAIGLIGLSTQSNLVKYSYKNPLVVVPFFIALLSIITLPFHDLPVRSFLGTVRTGDGILWWFDLSVLSASATLLWKVRKWRQTFILIALFSLTACATLSITHASFEHFYAPLYFKDYLAFALICFIPALHPFTTKFKPVLLSFTLFYGTLNVGMYVTDNKAMIGYALIFPLLCLGLWSILKKRQEIKNTLPLFILITLPILGLFAFVAIALIGAEEGFYTFGDTGLFRTVASRAYLINIAFQALLEEPWRFLTGYGWGSYVDHMVTQQPSEWLNFTSFEGKQWDGITFDHFHTHNMFADILNATGILGLILLILYIASFFFLARQSNRLPFFLFATGFIIYGSFWFLMPILIPFLVFASASANSHLATQHLKYFALPKKIILTALILFILAQPFAFFALFKTAQQTDRYEPNAITVIQAQTECQIDYNDFSAGGLHLSRLITDRLRYAVDLADITHAPPSKESTTSIPEHLQSLNHYFCQSGAYIENHASYARLFLSRLMMRGEILLALEGYIDQETQHYYYSGWQSDLLKWLEIAPNRTDITVPYFLYNLSHGQEHLSIPALNKIYNKDSENPIALWFKGLIDIQSPATANQGITFMKKAFKNGIERFVPIDEATKQVLQQHAQTP